MAQGSTSGHGRQRPGPAHDYLYALLQHFVVNGVTSVMTLEQRGPGAAPLPGVFLSSISDAIIQLGVTEGAAPRRTLRVVKARGTDHDLRPHEFQIQAGALRVLEPIST